MTSMQDERRGNPTATDVVENIAAATAKLNTVIARLGASAPPPSTAADTNQPDGTAVIRAQHSVEIAAQFLSGQMSTKVMLLQSELPAPPIDATARDRAANAYATMSSAFAAQDRLRVAESTAEPLWSTA